MAWYADYPDPDNFLRVAALKFRPGWRNEEYLGLVEQARELTVCCLCNSGCAKMLSSSRIRMYGRGNMLTIADCMKRQVVSVSASATVREVAQVVTEKRVGTLPVTDDQGVLIGVTRISDVLGVFMPDFVTLMDNIDFVQDFGALRDLRPKDVPQAAELTVRDIMHSPVAVEEECGLLRAAAVMVKHQVRDLPVVDNQGRLVGIASPVDIAVAFLSTWATDGPAQ
jgi:CBS-domain-containing membrane protein